MSDDFPLGAFGYDDYRSTPGLRVARASAAAGRDDDTLEPLVAIRLVATDGTVHLLRMTPVCAAELHLSITTALAIVKRENPVNDEGPDHPEG